MKASHQAPAVRLRDLLLAGACLLAATPALAQGAPEAGTEQIEEIVVTAQRREEAAQNVPIAITAIGGPQLTRQGVTNTLELMSAVPGLNYTRTVGTYGLPFIRGIGTTSQGAGLENPVATYIDGVYIFSTAGTAMSLRDVEQVTVLKGPQGTLFGRNAVGGLIQVTSRRPSFDPHGEILAGIGNRKSNTESLYLTGGITEKLAGSITLQNDQNLKGFGRNLFNGDRVNTRETLGGRAKLLWVPDEATEVTLSADYSRVIARAPVNRVFGTNSLGQTMAGGEFDTNLNSPPKSVVRTTGYTLNAARELGVVKLVSITGYRDDKIHTRFDADGATVTLQEQDGYTSNWAFTQELQLLSNTEGRLTWVAGAFYMKTGSNNWGSNTSRRLPTVTPGQTQAQFTTAYLASPISQTWNSGRQEIESWAGYAQATFKLTDATNLTAGIRYTADKRFISATAFTRQANGSVTQNASTAAAPNPSTNDAKFSDPSWRLSVDHRVSPELMVYASYNRGFRGGSFVSATSAAFLDPEYLDAFEGGFKSDLLDKRLRWNGAVYYYIDRGRKSTQVVLGQQTAFNAERAILYGFDTDLTWLVTNNLTLTAGLSGIRARYDKYTKGPVTVPASPLGFGGRILSIGDVSGNTLEATPKWTFNLSPSYRLPTEVGEFRATVNYYYNDGWWAAPDNRVRQPSYSTYAANLTWVPSFNDRLSFQLWGRNLTNQVYAEQYIESTQSDNYQVGAGRTYGLTVGYQF